MVLVLGGVVLFGFPADPLFDVEWHYAEDDGTGQPDMATVQIVGRHAASERFIHPLPLDGKLRHYQARHVRDGFDPDAWVGWISKRPVELRPPFPTPIPVAPIVHEQPSETGTTGTMLLPVEDPQFRIVKAEFWTQTGNEEPTDWVEDTTEPYSIDVALVEKHPGQIGYRVTGYDAQGVLRVLREDVVRFGIGSRPLPPLLKELFGSNGDLRVRLTGDSDTGSHRIVASTSGEPTEADVRAAPAIAGRSVTSAVLLEGVEPGQEVHIAAFAYSGAAGDGLESELARLPVVRDGGALVAGYLRAEVQEDGTAKIYGRIDGPAAGFDATLKLYQAVVDPGNLLATVTWTALEAGTEKLMASDIALPKVGGVEFHGEVRDVAGRLGLWAYAKADKNKLPGGDVYLLDGKANPQFRNEWDDDVKVIEITTPSGTHTKEMSDPDPDPNPYLYTIGVDTLDDGVTVEPSLAVGEERSGYSVVYKGGGQNIRMGNFVVKGTPDVEAVGNFIRVLGTEWLPSAGGAFLNLPFEVGSETRSFRVQYDYASSPGGAADTAVNYVQDWDGSTDPNGTHLVLDELGNPHNWDAQELAREITVTPYTAIGGGGDAGTPKKVKPQAPGEAGSSVGARADNKGTPLTGGPAQADFMVFDEDAGLEVYVDANGRPVARISTAPIVRGGTGQTSPAPGITGDGYILRGNNDEGLSWFDIDGALDSKLEQTDLDGYVQETRQILAGTGLTGGGDLSADRTINLATPVTVPHGGTGLTASEAGQALYGTDASTYALTSGGAVGQVLTRLGTALVGWDDAPGSNFKDTPPAAGRVYQATGIGAGDHDWSAWALPAGLIAEADLFLVSSSTTATAFRGLVAADIPDLDAAKITTGTFGTARIPDLDAAKITTGTFAAARIPGLDASKITSGALAVARGGLGADFSTTADNALLYTLSGGFVAATGGSDGQVPVWRAAGITWEAQAAGNFDDTPPAAHRFYQAIGTTAGAHGWSAWDLPSGVIAEADLFLVSSSTTGTAFRALTEADLPDYTTFKADRIGAGGAADSQHPLKVYTSGTGGGLGFIMRNVTDAHNMMVLAGDGSDNGRILLRDSGNVIGVSLTSDSGGTSSLAGGLTVGADLRGARIGAGGAADASHPLKVYTSGTGGGLGFIMRNVTNAHNMVVMAGDGSDNGRILLRDSGNNLDVILTSGGVSSLENGLTLGVPLAAGSGGTGRSSVSEGDILYGSVGGGGWSSPAAGSDGQVLTWVQGASFTGLAWTTVSSSGGNLDDTPPAANRFYQSTGTSAGAHGWSAWALPAGTIASADLFLVSSSTSAAAFRGIVAGDIPDLSGTYMPKSGGSFTGNVKTNSGVYFAVNGATPNSTYPLDVTGNVRTSGNYYDTSHRRWKDDLRDWALDRVAVMGLRPRTWRWNKPGIAGEVGYGFVSDEVAACFASEDGEAIAYNRMLVQTIALVQDHETRLERLERENAELRDRVAVLEAA